MFIFGHGRRAPFTIAGPKLGRFRFPLGFSARKQRIFGAKRTSTRKAAPPGSTRFETEHTHFLAVLFCASSHISALRACGTGVEALY
jgi:hypothetical protein